MRETRADIQQAVILAVLLHLLPLGVLVLAMLFAPGGRERVSAAGEPVRADTVDRDALSPAMRRALARAPEPLPQAAAPTEPTVEPEALPQPLDETVPESAPPQPDAQEMLPDPDHETQQAVRADAVSAETAEHEQQAQQRQGQVDLTADRKRQQEEENRRRENEMERQRQQQLADLQRRRDENNRIREEARARLQRLAEQKATEASQAAAANQNRAGVGSPPQGNRGQDSDPRARWIAEMLARIEAQWIRPDNVRSGVRCPIRIKLLAGGYVDSAEVQPGCPYDEGAKRSVEAAVMKASPLPYRGFEDVYVRDLTVNFIAP